MTAATKQGVPINGIADDYPLLWERAQQYDFAERLGGCTDPLLKEIDAALRECWEARRSYENLRAAFQRPGETDEDFYARVRRLTDEQVAP